MNLYFDSCKEVIIAVQIGWIDYSKEERNKIISILRLLKTQGTIDELGIGSVRDAFSDKLFPGISVLQTRAKYFVLIPYLFDLACQKCADGKLHNAKEVRNFIEKQEDKLVEVLLNSTKNNEEKNGIIGSRNYLSGKKSVKAKPSSIYWNGMRKASILLDDRLSMDSACGAIYQKGRMLSKTERKYEVGEAGSDDADVLNDGHTLFAPIYAKYDFMKEAQISLTEDEAEYIFHHFTESNETKNAAMAHMLKNPELITNYETFQEIKAIEFPEELAIIVRYAQQFADFIYGAHLLYNIIFAEGCGVNDGVIKDIRSDFRRYCNRYRRPGFDEIFRIGKCSEQTTRFFTDFDTCISRGNIDKAKRLIIDREEAVKPGRTKLCRPREYQFEEPIHFYKLSFRYDTAKRIMHDILEGLGE